MATFEVKVRKLQIEPHPNADTLSLALIDGYQSCVRKDEFVTGSLGVYLPEASIVPDWMLEKMNLVGRLSGSQKNRIKCIRLRKEVSQGIVYPVINGMIEGEDKNYPVKEGDDVANILGVTKWEPAVPSNLTGVKTKLRGSAQTISNWDVENVLKYNKVLEEDEEVAVEEKVHGTFVAMGYGRDIKPDHFVVHSKGLGARHVAFDLHSDSVPVRLLKKAIQFVYTKTMRAFTKPNPRWHKKLFKSEENADNIYIKTFRSLIQPAFIKMGEDNYNIVPQNIKWPTVYNANIYILGEIYGKNVQDLHYGTTEPAFACFDIYLGLPSQGRYLDYDEKVAVCKDYGIPLVPLIYMGPYHKELVDSWTNGKETVSGKSMHMREGVVIKPVQERSHPGLGRVMLKSVSPSYLMRGEKNGIEPTEFQ